MSETMNVRQVAALAKIALTEEEEIRLSAEMAGILAMARQLQQLEVETVLQTQHVLSIANVLREDAVKQGLTQGEILSAAPSWTDEYIAVPRTVE